MNKAEALVSAAPLDGVLAPPSTPFMHTKTPAALLFATKSFIPTTAIFDDLGAVVAASEKNHAWPLAEITAPDEDIDPSVLKGRTCTPLNSTCIA
jgi:hypothetical protein